MCTAERDFSAYVDNVLKPVCSANVPERELIDWLNRQLDEWEIEAERPYAIAFAPMAIDAIENILAAIEREPALRAA